MGIYEEILPFNEETSSEGEEETIVRKASASTPETAPKVPEQPVEPEKEGIIKKAVKWLKTHMTVVTVSAGLLLVLTAALLLPAVRRKRKNKERE